MKRLFIILFVLAVMAVIIWWRAPIIGEEWNKQTIYVGLLDAWHGDSEDEKAHAMWIDDDSTIGVYTVNTIANETGISPVFRFLCRAAYIFLLFSQAVFI